VQDVLFIGVAVNPAPKAAFSSGGEKSLSPEEENDLSLKKITTITKKQTKGEGGGGGGKGREWNLLVPFFILVYRFCGGFFAQLHKNCSSNSIDERNGNRG
jgi:hypothetical protein